jgi:hypothetical protein
MTEPFKVSFMIVGAQKCGTSTLSEMLRMHPALVRCDRKEPDFFSGCADWRAELPRYEQMFRRRPGALYYEASPSYTFYPHRKLELWNDLYDYNPALKIIYLVRDPIERLTSSYMHSYERGYTDLSFERTIIERAMLLDITRYATQITPFIERFGRDRVRIIFFDDLVRNPNGVVRELAAFLGIDGGEFGDVSGVHANESLGGHKLHHKFDNPGFLLSQVRRYAPPLWRAITDNSSRRFDRKPVLPPALRRAVLRLLRSEIDQLEAITGRDLSGWKGDAAVVGASPVPVG